MVVGGPLSVNVSVFPFDMCTFTETWLKECDSVSIVGQDYLRLTLSLNLTRDSLVEMMVALAVCTENHEM